MDTTSICITLIITIFGIAYPILFQVVSRLDEKYSSNLILELFNTEKERQLFVFSLILSLSSIFIYILKLPPIFDFGIFNQIVNNSALILLVAFAVILVISFFLFVEKILIYYTPTRFLKYLIKKHNSVKDKNSIYFKAISDILLFSIREQNETIARTISEFMYTEFQKQREQKESDPIEYPSSFYEVVYKATEELANLKNKKLSFLEYKTVGGLWLLGEFGNNKISETTYIWLWRNLLLAIKYERDDFILYYWQNAHHYISFQLPEILHEYSSDYSHITNEEDIQNRHRERNRFLEFHYALGGLLLYKKRYSCIYRIFNYTMSIPPKYELLPETMGEIFERFIEFRDPYEMKHDLISGKYPFPDVEGLNSDYIIKNWIIKYIALLFIRQYSIQPHLITMKPIQLPNIPKTQSEKRIWLDNIDSFKLSVEQILSNKVLLKETRLDFITDEWLKEQKKPKPTELLDLYKRQIEQDYEKTKIEQEISETKKKQFEESSKKIILETINLYDPINNPKEITKDFTNWFIYGEKAVMDKTAFVDDQEVSYLNFDSFLAEHISRKIKVGISETFFYTKSNSYLLKGNEIFPAIDRLKIDNNYVIIGFGQNLDWYKETFHIEELNKNSYKNIEIFNFQTCNYDLVGQSFFILKKNDLPNLLYKDISDNEIKKYSLKMIDDNIKLYSSIIDLNKSKELLEELIFSNKDKDLRKHVLVTLFLKLEIRWKNNINNIMLKLFSEFHERGLPDNLKDVKKVK